MSKKIRAGTIALCGRGMMGMITENEPLSSIYSADKKSVTYWVGIQLEEENGIGRPWSSRKPQVVGHISDYLVGSSVRRCLAVEQKLLEEQKEKGS